MTTVDKPAKTAQAFVPSREIRVLIVDEEEPLTNVVSLALRFEGWSVEAVASGQSAIERATAEPYDAILLDLMLPDMHGVRVVEALRREGITTPIVVVSGRTELEDKLAVFGAGADEYITKPFGLDEIARTLTRIFRRLGLSASSLVLGDLVLDVQKNKVWRDNERLMLSPLECELLRALLARQGEHHSVASLVASLADAGFSHSPAQVTRHLEALAETVNADWAPIIRAHETLGWSIAPTV